MILSYIYFMHPLIFELSYSLGIVATFRCFVQYHGIHDLSELLVVSIMSIIWPLVWVLKTADSGIGILKEMKRNAISRLVYRSLLEERAKESWYEDDQEILPKTDEKTPL